MKETWPEMVTFLFFVVPLPKIILTFYIMLSQEKINANFVAYVKRLEKYGCYSEEMMNDLGDEIKNAPFGMQDDSGAAYRGGMVNVVLNHLCKTAYAINETALADNATLKVNFDKLMKVLLLQHIAKAQMFVPQTESYWIKKGKLYSFNDDLVCNMKNGERSAYLCAKYGISLEEDEYEAIRIIDKTSDDASLYHVSPLAMLVLAVNQLTWIELRKEWENKQRKNTVEE